jgi:sterol desaturase/sphingolipid hydroxylase (fatty acid hydroxylase superfamily)
MNPDHLQALIASVSPSLYVFGAMIVALEAITFTFTRPQRDHRSRILSIKCGVLGFGFEYLLHAFGLFAAQLWIYQFRVFELGDGAEVFALCFIVNDLMFYVSHYAMHRVRLLWAIHCVHHCPRQYDLTTGICGSVLGPIAAAPFYIWIPILGIHPLIFLICDKTFKFVGLAYHTDIIGKLGFLEHVLVTPSSHRVHHASDAKYLDRNFGGLFIVFDKLFNTYAPEVETPQYGLTKDWHGESVWEYHVHELRDLFSDAQKAPRLADKIRYLIRPPGWRHDGTGKTADEIRLESTS